MKRDDPDYGISEEEFSSSEDETESDWKFFLSFIVGWKIYLRWKNLSSIQVESHRDVGLALITTWLKKSKIQEAS